jgi:hypothetical protein
MHLIGGSRIYIEKYIFPGNNIDRKDRVCVYIYILLYKPEILMKAIYNY